MSISCSQINPEISYNEIIPAPIVDGPISKFSSQSSIQFSGTCDKRIQSLEISFNQGSSWSSISKLDPSASIKCQSSSNFQSNLQWDLAHFDDKVLQSKKLQGLIRGIGDFGVSELGLFEINTSSSKVSGWNIIGQSEVRNSSYTLDSKITPDITSESSNTNYKLKSRIRSK